MTGSAKERQPVPLTQTILGAVIAGVIGLLTQLTALWLRRRAQREQWKRRLVRLCERLNWDGDPDNKTDVKLALYSFLDVQPLLEEHLASAPENTPEEVFEAYESMFEFKRRYGARAHASSGNAEDAKEISEEAQKMIRALDS